MRRLKSPLCRVYVISRGGVSREFRQGLFHIILKIPHKGLILSMIDEDGGNKKKNRSNKRGDDLRLIKIKVTVRMVMKMTFQNDAIDWAEIAIFLNSVIIFQHMIDVCTETFAKNCSVQVLSM